MKLSDKPGLPAKNGFKWKWAKGDATSLPELGDPTVGTAYRVCVYDGANSLVMNMAVPAGGICGAKPCWRVTLTSVAYKNKLATPDGVVALKVKTGIAGKASLKVKAKGATLAMPFLPPAQSPGPVTVQLINSTTTSCWEARYSSPAIFKPGTAVGTGKWKDKND